MKLDTRLTILTVFMLHGMTVGVLFSRIADLREALGLSEAQLGVALIGVPAGVLVGAQIVSRMVARLGTRGTILIAVPIFTAAPLIASFATGQWTLFAALMIFGLDLSIWNISMNIEADRVEAASGTRILNRCHALWGIGFLLSSLGGWIAVTTELAVRTHFAIHLVVTLTIALTVVLQMTPSPARGREKPPRRFTIPSAAVFALFGFAASGFVLEGAARNWSVIYMRDEAGAGESLANLALTAFILAQTGGRLFADILIDRRGPVAVGRASALTALAGLFLIVFAPAPYVALAGFALIGLGAATSYPQAISAAARLGGGEQASENVSALSTNMTVLAFLAPPLLGIVASNSSLGIAYALALPLPVLAFFMARHLAPDSTR
jgi:MFS family permease